MSFSCEEYRYHSFRLDVTFWLYGQVKRFYPGYKYYEGRSGSLKRVGAAVLAESKQELNTLLQRYSRMDCAIHVLRPLSDDADGEGYVILHVFTVANMPLEHPER